MKLQIIAITLLAAAALADKPWKGRHKNNKPWKRHHKGKGKSPDLPSLSTGVKQALDSCILDTCSAAYLTPACATCKSECFELFSNPRQRKKCVHFGKCFEICEKPAEKRAYKACKIRCKQAANTGGDDATKIAALKAVRSEGSTKLIAARKEALKNVAANKKTIKQERQAKKQQFHTCMQDGCHELLPKDCTDCRDKLHEKCADAGFRKESNFKNAMQCRKKINKDDKNELSCKSVCWGKGDDKEERKEFVECKKNCKKSIWGKDSDLVNDEGEMRDIDVLPGF